MRDPEETIAHKGFKIEVHYDDDVSCADHIPDDVHVWTWHRNYSIGEKPPCEPAEAEELIREHPGAVYLPIYAYEHGGIALSTGSFSCRWDSGQLGWIWTAEPGWTEAMLRSVIAELDDIMQGATFGYVVKSPEGANIDSCWNFVGRETRDGYMLDEARSAVDYEIARRASGEQLVAEAFAL
jgi:hypothetical protein